MSFELLFREGSFGSLKVKNRLVMPPMVRNYADKEGKVTPRYVAHIEKIARGGVGTMILEASFISKDGKGFMNQLGIHADAAVAGLKKLVAAAHKHGAVIGPQLYHAGRQTSVKITGRQPLAPSAVPDPTMNEIPEALDLKQIAALVGSFGKAAKRAKAAGFDFVEVHGAHGYLITQFLSPFSNRRTDAYGGSLENRMRFLLEVFASVRKNVGENYPIIVRLSGDEQVAGGLTIEETVKVAKRLEREGAAGVHISAGNYASYARGKMIPPMAVEDGVLMPLAREVKKSVGIPVITVAKIRDPKMAEAALRDGTADFIGIGRTLLADPEWPRKVQEGRLDEIMPCIACNQGCISRLFAQQDVWCTVNPETGREERFAKKPGAKKKVVVLGGGPAGLSAAKTAAQRGHKVTLYEKSGRLGGQLFAAEAAPHRDGWRELRSALVRDVKRLGVDIRLKREYDAAQAKKDKPDLIVVAVGSDPLRPNIPGIGRTNVVVSRDVLEGRAELSGKVAVVGGGCAGAQTAEFIAERGHSVALIEMGGAIAADAPVDDRALLLGRLEKLGVKSMTETKVMNIGPSSVSIENPAGPGSVPADTVVVCLGSFPNDGVTDELRKSAKKVLAVGDAMEPRRVTEAMAEGALAALTV